MPTRKEPDRTDTHVGYNLKDNLDTPYPYVKLGRRCSLQPNPGAGRTVRSLTAHTPNGASIAPVRLKRTTSHTSFAGGAMRWTRIVRGTLGVVAVMAAPSMSVAQDTTRTGQVATGEVSSERINNLGLDRGQIERLQQRLNEMGCDAGPVDGLIGPRTREAMNCARTRENIAGQDVQSLLRGLGLEADQLDSLRPDSVRLDTLRDTTRVPRDSVRRDTTRVPRDSVRRDTTRVPRDSVRFDTLRDTTRVLRDSVRRDTLRDTTRVPRDPVRRPPPR